ncbi:Site-specific recombinase XerD [Prevotellaceae bacterium MN60]|nr:Site-specific recombinase XerD [Prevotellaceae bacterium MN60]
MIHISFQVNIHWGSSWLRRKNKQQSKTIQKQRLEERAQEAMEELSRRRAKSTIDNYQTALRSLLTYAGKDICTEQIDVATMEGYQRWLQLRGVSRNTSSCYMRSLRALLRHIDAEGEYKEAFKSVYTGNEKTEKRAITEEELKRLKSPLPTSLMGSPLPTSPHWGRRKEQRKDRAMGMARDLFLFSFCALGMPFVDLAFLKKSQVKDGYIDYRRHKTGQHIRVKIEPLMQEIIDKYARKDGLYLFPILTHSNHEEAMREYERQRSRYNRLLGELSRKLNLPHLTSYVARHSWASIAYGQDVALPIITKAMGHTSTQTTLTYIREINDHRIEEANSRLVNIAC